MLFELFILSCCFEYFTDEPTILLFALNLFQPVRSFPTPSVLFLICLCFYLCFQIAKSSTAVLVCDGVCAGGNQS